MANANLTMGVKGIDKTGAAFNSIRNRAKVTGAQIRATMGGAIAAAGAYLSLRSINGAIGELSDMSNAAMRAGTSVEFLTKSAMGFEAAGLKIDSGKLIGLMNFMQKNTGLRGEGPFFGVLKQLAAIPDAGERAKAAIGVFDRNWTSIAPLINGGEGAVGAIQELIDLMPGMSTAAAKSGEEAKDAISIFTGGIHNIFLKSVGNIVGMFAEELPGGMRAGALSAVNWLQTFAKKAKAVLTYVGAVIGSNIGLLINGFMPAMKIVGSSIVKVFSTVWESLKYVGTSIKAVMSLAVDAMTDGPKAAWEAFKNTMSEANGKFSTKFFDTADIKEQVDQLKMAGEIWADQMKDAKKEVNDSLDAANESREKYLAKLKTLNVNDLAGALGGNGGKSAAPLAEEIGTAAAKAAHRVTNQLMLAGSSAANRLSVLGPEYQNETKKQTDLLRKIAQNTEKTAENTDDMGDTYTPTDL